MLKHTGQGSHAGVMVGSVYHMLIHFIRYCKSIIFFHQFTDSSQLFFGEHFTAGVGLVIPEENWEQKVTDVQMYHIDTFVMGDDWKGKFDFLKDYCEVVYLPRTPEISTTQIKKELKK